MDNKQRQEEVAKQAKAKAAKIRAAKELARKNADGSDDFSDDDSPKDKASQKDKDPKVPHCYTFSFPFHCLTYIFPRLPCSFSIPIPLMYLASTPILSTY